MGIKAEEAKILVRKSLGQPYKEEPFRQLVSNILPTAEMQHSGPNVGQYIPGVFSDYVTSYKRLVKVRGKENIDALAVKLKSFGSMVNARSMQRRFIARYLNGAFGGNPKDAALVAFYVDDAHDWRFSLVYKQYTFEDDAAKTILSEPRRASFLVGPNELTHTAEQQFVGLLQAKDRDTLARLSTAFSVEKVTDEFFAEYKRLFSLLENTVQRCQESSQAVQAEFERCGIEAAVYAKRLLGQIVFLYFLQKKGWLGVGSSATWGSGSHTWLHDLFKLHQNENFFSEILNPLFYDALATDRSVNNHYFPLLSCRIPFLNGGLFEPVGGHDWRNTPVKLENSFFLELFESFNRYNFTVREDEPLESEVAVDPEMLGKVFESLLGVEERREKGTFYTPRRIVHYMCRESLVQYLARSINTPSLEYVDAEQMLPGLSSKKQPTLPGIPIAGKVAQVKRQVRVPLQDITAFIRQDEQIDQTASLAACKKKSNGYTVFSNKELPDSVKQYARELDDALAKMTICDPAIGSGAFAVGMMHEIIQARRALHNERPDLFGGQSALPTAYDLKRHTIGNSLYGVDIDVSAVDIAKLRLWLSLVVDEDDYTSIKPLPNLDYKIMIGNSLDAWRDTNDIRDSGHIIALDKLKKKYFDVTDNSDKIKLHEEINKIRKQCGTLGSFDWLVDFSNIFHQNNKRNGFDIVIGNPPYIQLQNKEKISEKDRSAYKKLYQVFASTGDVYCLFYELGWKLLCTHGILAFITSNKWMRAAYGEAMRKFLSDKTNPLCLIDFAGNKVFDSATVDVNIIVFEKNLNTGQTEACIIKDDCSTNLSDYIERRSTTTRFETGESWAILSPIEQSIKRKIEAVGVPLKDWGVNIYRGVLTGYNEAFIISGAKKDELIAADPKSAEIIRPILRGRDIKRYDYNFAELWVILAKFGSHKYLQKDYPAIFAHLSRYEAQLKQRGQCRYNASGKVNKDKPYPGQHHWLELDNNPSDKYLDDFSKQKIAWGNLCLHAQYAYVEEAYYVNNPANIIVPGDKYILSVLNSKAADFYMRNLGVTRSGGYFEYKPMFVEKLPIPQLSPEDKDKYINIVDKIINTQNDLRDIVYFEHVLNMLIYTLYNLSSDEINFLEK
jgi:methylase of polypeptide subunit release factors